jgi:hypothetical protein
VPFYYTAPAPKFIHKVFDILSKILLLLSPSLATMRLLKGQGWRKNKNTLFDKSGKGQIQRMLNGSSERSSVLETTASVRSQQPVSGHAMHELAKYHLAPRDPHTLSSSATSTENAIRYCSKSTRKNRLRASRIYSKVGKGISAFFGSLGTRNIAEDRPDNCTPAIRQLDPTAANRGVNAEDMGSLPRLLSSDIQTSSEIEVSPGQRRVSHGEEPPPSVFLPQTIGTDFGRFSSNVHSQVSAADDLGESLTSESSRAEAQETGDSPMREYLIGVDISKKGPISTQSDMAPDPWGQTLILFPDRTLSAEPETLQRSLSSDSIRCLASISSDASSSRVRGSTISVSSSSSDGDCSAVDIVATADDHHEIFLKGIPDTGARNSIMSEEVAGRFGLVHMNTDIRPLLKGLGREKLRAKGQMNIKFHLANEEQWYRTHFYVVSDKDVDDAYDTLLCSKVVKRLNIFVRRPTSDGQVLERNRFRRQNHRSGSRRLLGTLSTVDEPLDSSCWYCILWLLLSAGIGMAFIIFGR